MESNIFVNQKPTGKSLNTQALFNNIIIAEGDSLIYKQIVRNAVTGDFRPNILENYKVDIVNNFEADIQEANNLIANNQEINQLKNIEAINSQANVQDNINPIQDRIQENIINFEDNNIKIPGNRVTYLQHVLDETTRFNISHQRHNPNCNEHLRYVKQYTDLGLQTNFVWACIRCDFHRNINTQPLNFNTFTINQQAVSGTITSGIPYNNIKETLAAIDVPFLCESSYKDNRISMIEPFEKAYKDSIKKAGEEEYRLAVEAGQIENGCVWIAVVADGSWLKRSYNHSNANSLAGTALIIGERTGKILYAGVRNKYCDTCKKRGDQGPIHPDCFQNWDVNSSSSSMEAAIIAKGFELSYPTHNLIYKYLIADGDSSMHQKIIDHKVYEQFGFEVVKIECTNHLFRNLGTKYEKASYQDLSGVVIATGILKFREMVKNRALRFRKKVIEMAANVKDLDLSAVGKERMLQDQITNHLTNHVFGDHRMCQRNNIPCEGAKKNEVNYAELLRDTVMYQKLEEAAAYIGRNSGSLIFGETNNIVECANSIIAKTLGGKRVNWAQADA